MAYQASSTTVAPNASKKSGGGAAAAPQAGMRLLKPAIRALLLGTRPGEAIATTSTTSTTNNSNTLTDAANNASRQDGRGVLQDVQHHVRDGDGRNAGADADAATVLLIDRVTTSGLAQSTFASSLSSFADGAGRTYRLWLSDGRMSIQALFRDRALRMLIDDAVGEGSLVALEGFELRHMPRVSGSGEVCVLIVTSVAEVGVDGKRRRGKEAQQEATHEEMVAAAAVGKAKADGQATTKKEDTAELDISPENLFPGVLGPRRDSAFDPSESPYAVPTDDIYIRAPEPEPEHQDGDSESVDLIPSVRSTPVTKRRFGDPGSGGQKDPLSVLDGNRPRKRPRTAMDDRPNLMMPPKREAWSPEKLFKHHAAEFYEALKALQPKTPPKRKADDQGDVRRSPEREPSSGSAHWVPSSAQESQLKATAPTAADLSPPSSPEKLMSPSKRRRVMATPSKLRQSPLKLSPTKMQKLSSPSRSAMIPRPPAPRTTSPARSLLHTQQPPSQSPPPSLPPLPSQPLQPITKPLNIVSLASVTGRNASRNRIFDFLIIVSHVNPRVLVRRGFPDSRELLVMDASTAKQVHLTVFVDAANFRPDPGTVALMRNITTHEYGGGSLKAYHQRCAGTRWWIEDGTDEEKEDEGHGRKNEEGTRGAEGDGAWEYADKAEELRRMWLECDSARTVPERSWWTERGVARFANRS